MAKVKVHNEYFRTVSLSKRKSCPSCHAKLLPAEQIWSWGNYVSARWYTVQYFCKQCWDECQQRLIAHAQPCGCTFQLIAYHGDKLPAWLTLGDICER